MQTASSPLQLGCPPAAVLRKQPGGERTAAGDAGGPLAAPQSWPREGLELATPGSREQFGVYLGVWLSKKLVWEMGCPGKSQLRKPAASGGLNLTHTHLGGRTYLPFAEMDIALILPCWFSRESITTGNRGLKRARGSFGVSLI